MKAKEAVILFVAIVGMSLLGIALINYLGQFETPKGIESLYPTTEVSLPEPSNYAVDAAGVLSTDQLNNLNDVLKGYSDAGQEIAVAIVKTTKPTTIEDYGIMLGDKWKVGKADVDNGAIIIVATEDRKVRIEVGYGLEGNLPDSKAGRIIDNEMIPHLKTGDWYSAVLQGAKGVFEAGQ